MKRKLFFSFLAAFFLCLPLSVAAQKQNGHARQQKSVKKELCLQLYSVRDLVRDINKDGKAEARWTSLLSRLHDMGYTSVEAAWYDQEHGTFYNRKAKDFKADVEKAGMKVLSSHVNHSLTAEELASGDFTKALDWWKKCIADHKAAGMSYIVNPWIGLQKSIHDLDVYCRYLNAIGKMCKEAGLSFGYHNHNYEFEKVEGQLMYDYMLEHTNPEYVFFQMDMYWTVRGAASPVEYFKRYPGRFRSYHCKDHREIGQSGMVGWDAIFRNAKTAGVRYIVAEIEQCTMPVEQSIKVSAQYLLSAPFVKSSYSVSK